MQIEVTPRNVFIAGVIAGVVFGLIPLGLGLIRKNLKLGAIGLMSSIIGGAIMGIYLAIPASAAVSWMILRRPIPSANGGAETSTESLADDVVKESENS